MNLKKYLIIFCTALLIASAADAQQRNNPRAVLTIPEVGKEDIICFALYTVHDIIVKAGKNAPDTIISKRAKAGGRPQTVTLN